MHNFAVHSNQSVCRKSGRLGLEQVLNFYCLTQFFLNWPFNIVRPKSYTCVPLLSILLKHLWSFSGDQVPRHTKLLVSRGQVLVPDNLVEEGQELEEGLWTSHPKQRNVDRHRLDVPLSRLGLDTHLKGFQLVHPGLADSWVGLVGYRRRQARSLPLFFWCLYFHNLIQISS